MSRLTSAYGNPPSMNWNAIAFWMKVALLVLAAAIVYFGLR